MKFQIKQTIVASLAVCILAGCGSGNESSNSGDSISSSAEIFEPSSYKSRMVSSASLAGSWILAGEYKILDYRDISYRIPKRIDSYESVAEARIKWRTIFSFLQKTDEGSFEINQCLDKYSRRAHYNYATNINANDETFEIEFFDYTLKFTKQSNSLFRVTFVDHYAADVIYEDLHLIKVSNNAIDVADPTTALGSAELHYIIDGIEVESPGNPQPIFCFWQQNYESEGTLYPSGEQYSHTHDMLEAEVGDLQYDESSRAGIYYHEVSFEDNFERKGANVPYTPNVFDAFWFSEDENPDYKISQINQKHIIFNNQISEEPDSTTNIAKAFVSITLP